MMLTHSIGQGQVSLIFDGKPSEHIRSILKTNRFRWSPVNKFWWRQSTNGVADLIDYLRKELDREAGIRRIDGACRKCGEPEGYWRDQGAGAMLLCDNCSEEYLEEQRILRYGEGGAA